MPLLKHYIKNDILFLKLNDPKSQNAFSPAMAEEFSQTLSSTDYKALILFAEGPFFCSGGNLHFYKDLKTKQEGMDHNNRILKILDELDSYIIPKACFINGACLGGGIELISCFDYICASPQSLFGLWQRRVGLSFGWGGGERLRRRIPLSQLKLWLSAASTLSVYRVKQLGLVDKITLPTKGLECCQSWIENSLKYGEQSLELILNHSKDDQEVFSELWLEKQHRDALKKFE